MGEWSKPDSWYEISGRGWVAHYDLRPRRRAGELRSMRGQTVEVQGEQMTILGVETFAVADGVRVGDVGFLLERRPRRGMRDAAIMAGLQAEAFGQKAERS